MSIEETWQAIQIRKDKITKLKEVVNKDEIENHLLAWSKLHHNQAISSPALHPEHGVRGEPNNIPSEEKDYRLWIEELNQKKHSMAKLDLEFVEFKDYIKMISNEAN